MGNPKMIWVASIVTLLVSSINLVASAPDVLDLPSQDFSPGSPNSGAGCAKLATRQNECVEKISKMDYVPVISVIEQKYTVPVPNIIYSDVVDPQEQKFEVKMPKIVKTKVPLTTVKEQPMTKTLTKIREVIETVPIVTTDVIKIPKTIPQPKVTKETIVVQNVKKMPETKVVKKYKPKTKTITIDTYKEEPTVRKIRRPILVRVPKQVNRTRIEYIKKVVEVPTVVYKKLRLPNPVIKKGETIQVQMGNAKNVTNTYVDEYPEYMDQEVMVDQIKREPKTINIPYKEKTRVVRPQLLEAVIDMPDKQMVMVERHTKVPGPEVMVPCGVPTAGTPYLPANCPACNGASDGTSSRIVNQGSGGNCPTCPTCQMESLHL